ncbi:hypothetical protein VTK73DRAFT_4953 [Phialemonium thermophilum]|uniref:Uncharacterized protein n=1 Tax=Phialemonium thermophilum TaxID=223376 RepID=A0ABR3WR56_9PEZI
MLSKRFTGHLFPALAAAAALRSRQYDDGSYGEAIDCKVASLTEPAWFIYDPRYSRYNYTQGGTLGQAGFEAYNTVTNESFVCIETNIDLNATGTDAPWYNCSIPTAQFQFDLNAGILGLRETWSCDNDASTTFAGNGTRELPMALGCGSDTDYFCLYGNTEIRAGLTSPVHIDPYVPWTPAIPYEYPDNCPDRSYYPTWQIEGLVYEHNSTVSGPGAVSAAAAATITFLSFNLTNLSNGKTVACDVAVNETLTRSSSHASHWVSCDPADAGNVTAQGGVAGTKIMFDRDYSIIGVEQSWRCMDKETSEDDYVAGTIFSGMGYLVSKLDCTNSAPYDGSMDPSKSVYSCTLPTSNVTGYRSDDTPIAIPHTLYTHSCTINSMNGTALVLRDYKIETRDGAQGDDDDSAPNTASFTLFNPGPGDEYRIGNIAVRDDGEWHACAGDDDSLPWQLLSCQYMLDRANNTLGFRLQWNCDDRDPYHALIFNATATGHFPKELCKTTTQSDASVMSCSLPAGSDGGVLGIEALDWTATSGPMTRGPVLPWI